MFRIINTSATRLNQVGIDGVGKTFRILCYEIMRSYTTEFQRRRRGKGAMCPPPLPQQQPPKRVRRVSRVCPPLLLKAQPPPKATPTGIGVMFAGVVLVCWGVIAFAKHDPDFRVTLNEYVPYTDDLIRLLYQEEKPFMDSIRDFIDSLW